MLDDTLMSTARKFVNAEYEPGDAEAIAAMAPIYAGSCALLAMLDVESSVIPVANTGDSRAVLGSWSPEQGKYLTDALNKD